MTSSLHSEKTAVNRQPPHSRSSSNATLDPTADPTAEPRSELAKQVEEEHAEKHSTHGEALRDIILGVADGLTVPFALTAGLSSYVLRFLFYPQKLTKRRLGSPRLVVIGGLAELFSGAISMGLGAYLTAVSESEHYDAEYAREKMEVAKYPKTEEKECYEILEKYGIPHETLTPVIDALMADEAQWLQVHILPT
jgi:vacuolar iron transporter family protein